MCTNFGATACPLLRRQSWYTRWAGMVKVEICVVCFRLPGITCCAPENCPPKSLPTSARPIFHIFGIRSDVTALRPIWGAQFRDPFWVSDLWSKWCANFDAENQPKSELEIRHPFWVRFQCLVWVSDSQSVWRAPFLRKWTTILSRVEHRFLRKRCSTNVGSRAQFRAERSIGNPGFVRFPYVFICFSHLAEKSVRRSGA